MIQDLNEISDGKVYQRNDMVRAGCDDCAGCHACCEGMGESIILDPIDIYRITAGTKEPFSRLAEEKIGLHVFNGIVLPYLRMSEKNNCCVYLDAEGRCGIHAFRPGLCRAFPLGRIYEENRISYFLQKDACRKEKRSKVKVIKWLDMSDLKKYETYLLDWHRFRKKVEQFYETNDDENAVKTLNLFILNHFFIKPYQPQIDFYEQFRERLEQAEEVLHL